MRTLQSQIGWCARVQWMLGGGIVFILITFYVFGYRPMNGELQDLQAQIEAHRRTLEQNQSRTRIMPTVALEVENRRAELARFDKQMPKQPELGQFIKDIDSISQQNALRNMKLEPGSPRRNELFAELPIVMKFEGDFLSVFSFLRQTEDMDRLTRMRSLSVKSRDAKRGFVEVQLAMNIYFSE